MGGALGREDKLSSMGNLVLSLVDPVWCKACALTVTERKKRMLESRVSIVSLSTVESILKAQKESHDRFAVVHSL